VFPCKTTDAAVTPVERSWLKQLFDKGYEQALLDFLAQDGIRPL
jgi:hypothetical protein